MGSVSSNPLFDRKNFNDIYELGEEIGVGSFATVHKCCRKADSHEFAVKLVNKYILSNRELVGISNEIKVLKKVSHENIIKLVDVFDDGSVVSLVLELCNGKDLCDEIKIISDTKKSHFCEKKSAEIIYSLADGLQHLHQNGIVHRDIKPENVLVATDGTIKISDFGLAKNIVQKSPEKMDNSYESSILYTACGTSLYVAPEVVENNGYNNKCDTWSLGVILYNLLVGYQPFDAENNHKIYDLIIKGKYDIDSEQWNHVSEKAKDLVKCLLEKDPSKRYSANEIKHHPWIIKHIRKLSLSM